MKIIVDYNQIIAEKENLKIDIAEYLQNYSIQLKFNDGYCNQIDFEPFLTQSIHPSIRKYLKKDLFADFKIIDGNLNWNDYDLIFPIADLYEGRIGN